MSLFPLGLVFVPFLLFPMASSEEQDVITALVEFMAKLSPGNVQRDLNFGWNDTSNPCTDKWEGVTCDTSLNFVKKIVLDEYNLTGVLDAESLCQTSTLLVLSLVKNNIAGELGEEISGCKNLTHLYLSDNRFSGSIPDSVSELSNLKRFNVSHNNFTGELPDMSKVTGLLSYLAENNQFTGGIPQLEFSNLVELNVSNNNLSGPIPDVAVRLGNRSFLGNPGLCGKPLSNVCPIVSPPPGKGSQSSLSQFLMYSGYAVLALIVVLFVAFIMVKKRKSKNKVKISPREVRRDDSDATTTNFMTGGNRSEFSLTSAETGSAASSLVVVSTPMVNGMKFDDLLRAPAELLGRGKHGSLYKVTPNGGVNLVVKRIKDWPITKDDFKKKMQRVGQVLHPKVLPIVAYYCSKEEKLLVYEYQRNGSLFRILHGLHNGQMLNWGSRLNMAASISEALAFMHEELDDDGIAHGNLKSSNIMLNEDMEACISEYGLMVVHKETKTKANNIQTDSPDVGHSYTFKDDINSLGEILLELLTGQVAQNRGPDLARWVHSVAKEEWMVQVFDKSLAAEGASEERIVNLLQVALKCINVLPDARPNMNQIADMINSIKEEEERSISC
ncbi:inactive leucine-rich repeat receptor-like serine/threonine-protein kinase At1g60630 [Apium graveolens]|uniref:inactive leucine-rich repeat receptor-like serine/threonine-protein kinase At1g60630 n=1 Tax=Apium graveolens TaxID=4045 RepID=UPI003D7B4D8C